MKDRLVTERSLLKEINPADYIQKLRMLEQRIGATTQYQNLSPFRCNPKDAVNLQEAAKRIAGFIGLQDLTFIVAVARQKEKIGGHVELEAKQQVVFIEISPEVSRSSASTLAVLAHEVTHKFMQRHGISLGRGLGEKYENEILTDITGIFVGLGKVMLNGAEALTATWKGGRQAIQSVRTGYLSARQLAFVYRLICAMRGVNKRKMMSGLTSQAKFAVRACRRWQREYFDPRFRDNGYRQKRVRDLRSDASHVEEKLDELKKNVGLAKRNLEGVSGVFLPEAERNLSDLHDRMSAISATEIYNPCYRFLDTVNLAAEIHREHTRLIEVADRADRWAADLDKLLGGSD